DLHPVGALIGKDVGAVVSGFAKTVDDTCQHGIGACAHIERLARQPDLVDAKDLSGHHCISALSQVTDRSISRKGHSTVIEPCGAVSLMVTAGDCGVTLSLVSSWVAGRGRRTKSPGLPAPSVRRHV